MEVHHHGHIHTKKKWLETLFQFIMLFLAVFLGFLAENEREHYIEGKREKFFIASLKGDLKKDIEQLTQNINTRLEKDRMMASLLYLLKHDTAGRGSDIYYYARWLPRTYRFFSNDRTFLQLKNAGNWRLIHNEGVSLRLQLYDQQVRTITAYIEAREESLVQLIYPSLHKLFDSEIFESMVDGLSFRKPRDNPKLMPHTPAELNAFCNQIHFLKNSNNYFINNAQTLLNQANETLAMVDKEY